MTRVLLFCPTVKLSHAVFDGIHGLRFGDALDRLFTCDNPHGAYNGHNVLYNYLKAEYLIKAQDYDYLLTVEDDILVPPDALEKMIAVDADIVYGVYCFRKGPPTINIARPDDLQQSYSLPHNLSAWQALFGSVIECGGLGLGCTLIKRAVFDVLEFHSDKGFDADTQLALDARRLGLRQMSDTSVLCGHKRADSTIVWPARGGYTINGTPQPEPTLTVSVIRPIVYWDYHDNLITLQPGETRAIDPDHALAYVEMGLAEMAA